MVASAAVSLLAACGGGGGGSAPASNPTPAPTSTPGSTPSPTPSPAATAKLNGTSLFPWRVEKAANVQLLAGSGQAISNKTCTATGNAVSVSKDCTKITLNRIGDHSITVSGEGVSAKLTVKGVPQAHWAGQNGGNGNVGDGISHAVVQQPSGKVLTWGGNGAGRLAQLKSYLTQKFMHTPALALQSKGVQMTNIRQVSAGKETTLALNAEGNVLAWGRNGHCQLAQKTDGNNIITPVYVKNAAGNGKLGKVVQVASGGSNQAALLDTGEVMSWGYWHGQGNDKRACLPGYVKTPDGKSELSGIVQVSAGGSYTLALSETGQVYAWGYDLSQGTLGAGKTLSNATKLPNLVLKSDGKPLSGIVSISAGHTFAMALAADGSVWAWGANASGQLGRNVKTYNGEPAARQVMATPTTALKGVSAIAAGQRFAMALKASDGSVLAWGAASDGQLGDGANPAGTERLLPDTVTDSTGKALKGVRSIAATIENGVALMGDGKVKIWGDGFHAALGSGKDESAQHWPSTRFADYVVGTAPNTQLTLAKPSAWDNLLQKHR